MSAGGGQHLDHRPCQVPPPRFDLGLKVYVDGIKAVHGLNAACKAKTIPNLVGIDAVRGSPKDRKADYEG